MARDLLDHVVEGPEDESIWAVFQGGPEGESAEEDEEVELGMQ